MWRGRLARDLPTVFPQLIVLSSQTADGPPNYPSSRRGFSASATTVPSPTLVKYRYRRLLPHLQKADCDLFVTFCTHGHTRLPAAARELVFAHCLREHGKRITLHAVVVMPDHVHLLLFPLRDAEGWPWPLVDILHCLKSATAHRINKLLHLSGPVWEEESFDHVLRSDESRREKCEYIAQNPVRKGLVSQAENYRWLWVNPELLTRTSS